MVITKRNRKSCSKNAKRQILLSKTKLFENCTDYAEFEMITTINAKDDDVKLFDIDDESDITNSTETVFGTDPLSIGSSSNIVMESSFDEIEYVLDSKAEISETNDHGKGDNVEESSGTYSDSFINEIFSNPINNDDDRDVANDKNDACVNDDGGDQMTKMVRPCYVLLTKLEDTEEFVHVVKSNNGEFSDISGGTFSMQRAEVRSPCSSRRYKLTSPDVIKNDKVKEHVSTEEDDDDNDEMMTIDNIDFWNVSKWQRRMQRFQLAKRQYESYEQKNTTHPSNGNGENVDDISTTNANLKNTSEICDLAEEVVEKILLFNLETSASSDNEIATETSQGEKELFSVTSADACNANDKTIHPDESKVSTSNPDAPMITSKDENVVEIEVLLEKQSVAENSNGTSNKECENEKSTSNSDTPTTCENEHSEGNEKVAEEMSDANVKEKSKTECENELYVFSNVDNKLLDHNNENFRRAAEVAKNILKAFESTSDDETPRRQ